VNRQIRNRRRIEDVTAHVDLRLATGLIDDAARRAQVVRRDRVDDVRNRQIVRSEQIRIDEHFVRGLRRAIHARLRDALILLERGNDLIIGDRAERFGVVFLRDE